MFGSEVLEVGIGLILVFLLVSAICSAVREGIEGWLKTRAAFLEQGLRELLHDPHAVGLARSFYTHPLVYSLYAGRYEPGSGTKRPGALAKGDGLPSYIPSRNFALALLDIAARGPGNAASAANGSSPVLSLATVRANVTNLENAYVQRVLLTAIDTARGDLDRAVANLGAWYDSGMDRVSGAYKRATQKVLFVIGLAISVGMNIDAVTIARFLYRDDAARSVIVARAERAASDSATLRASYSQARAALDSLRLPIGWPRRGVGLPAPGPAGAAVAAVPVAPPWPESVLGWLITAFATMLGAPFWFDLLNKVMVVRSTVKPREKSQEESSEDRQSQAGRERAAAQQVGAHAPPAGAGIAGADAAGVEAAAVPPGAVRPAGGGAAARPQPPGAAADPLAPPTDAEAEADFDGCSVAAETLTEDEDLPEAHGGVA